MKTKEEILEKHIGAPIPLVGDERCTKTIEVAMDEYAKQQAIVFDIWKRKNGYLIDPGGEVYLKLIVEGDLARNEPVFVDEVYNLFIESQNK